MKLQDSRITILVSESGTTIEIIDGNAATTFCKVFLTPIQFSQALSRLSHTKCEIEVSSLDRVGKIHQNETFIFKIPKELRSSTKSKELLELCKENLVKCDMGDWIPDSYFSSQNTFSEKEGQCYAQTTIRSWI